MLGLAVTVMALVAIDWTHVLPLLAGAWDKASARNALGVAALTQTLALSTCAVALRVLSAPLTIASAALSRWVRDAVGALPAGLPGLGEAAGIRALALFGIGPTEAIAVTTADILAETLAQAAYALLAVLLAPSSLRVATPPIGFPIAPFAAALVAVVAGAGLLLCLAPAVWRAGGQRLLSRTGERLRSPRFAGSFVIHLLAWVMGGLQVFLITAILGSPLTLEQALSLEGLVFALRAAFFFVPAGLGVQELGLAAIGAAYGMAPIDAAALALLFRLRDMVVLTPGLIAWAVIEVRRVVAPSAPQPSKKIESLPCT